MPRRSLQALAAAHELSAAQDGLITAAQLEMCGFPPSTVNRRIRAGGPWLRVLPGVYDVRRDPLVGTRRHRAAALYAGHDAAFTGRAALARYGLRSSAQLPMGNELILIPHGIRRQSAGFVVIERTRRLPDQRNELGFRIATPARALIDLARHCGVASDVDAVLAEALRRSIVSYDELAKELKEAPIRGSAVARASLRALRATLLSGPEIAFYRLWESAGMPAALWNPTLHTRRGDFLAMPDVYVPELGVAIEIDSQEHHSSTNEWAKTLHRHSRMTAAGLIVLHYTPRRIREDGSGVLAEIRQTLDAQRRLGRTGLADIRIVTAGRAA